MVAFAEFAPLSIVVAIVVGAVAFHWLWRGLPTAANSPERRLPLKPTLTRIGAHGLLHAALAAATIGAILALGAHWGDGILVRAAVGFAVGALLGALAWGPLGSLVILGYGMPLRAATAAMDAPYPDVVDGALVRTHRRLAIAAAIPAILGVAGFLRAPAFDGLPSLALAMFLFVGLAAIAVPVRAARRACRRLAARKARIGNDLQLLPILPEEAERLTQLHAHLPILGEVARPTHLLVPVTVVENYRVAATPEEPLALVAVAEDARATDSSAKGR